VSYSNPQTEDGRPSERIELRCQVLNQPQAFFRIDRTTFKGAPDQARRVFISYMKLVRSSDSDDKISPPVIIAATQRRAHQDFTLAHKAAHGDLSYREVGRECAWNFYGLAGNSIIQALMVLPKGMCPETDKPVLTNTATQFYGSIIIEGSSTSSSEN
jgi:hypothetical protein